MYSISKPSTLNHLQPNPDRIRKQPTAFAAAATCIRPLHPGSPFHSYPSVRLPPPLKLSVARISPPSTPPHHASTHSDHADLHTRTCSWSHPCSNTWIHLCTHMAVPVSMPVNASLSLSPSLSLPPSLPPLQPVHLSQIPRLDRLCGTAFARLRPLSRLLRFFPFGLSDFSLFTSFWPQAACLPPEATSQSPFVHQTTTTDSFVLYTHLRVLCWMKNDGKEFAGLDPCQPETSSSQCPFSFTPNLWTTPCLNPIAVKTPCLSRRCCFKPFPASTHVAHSEHWVQCLDLCLSHVCCARLVASLNHRPQSWHSSAILSPTANHAPVS